MEQAFALVTVRDINLLCQHYKTYAQIEGQTQQLVTNGCSPSPGSSGSMSWAFQFGICPRIFGDSEPTLTRFVGAGNFRIDGHYQWQFEKTTGSMEDGLQYLFHRSHSFHRKSSCEYSWQKIGTST